MKLNVTKYVDNKFPKTNYNKKTNISAFAASIGVSFAAAKAIYNGETTRIAFDTLEAICLVLDCTPNDILILDPQPQTVVRESAKKILSQNGIEFNGTKESEQALEEIVKELNKHLQSIKK